MHEQKLIFNRILIVSIWSHVYSLVVRGDHKHQKETVDN